ncbi:NAD(P)H-binding protein [Bailinhaonella thermotolerans]|uniref:NAD-dependent epimerase/dehydratase family protein n=1 Tax=Bailinhaonella thermotolerans TaxID=1070861 RepID=A0A3A4A9L9_9ACTN|nr:NAD(P)H-binding protein [Bailinhaonella thermotolerans]RJL22740.1 NAD-dependent epimerase/dehydratase family protein [Bailinhaonella thermotolerans]
MRVVIAGGHGKIALRLERLLAARGDEPVGIVRNPGHLADLSRGVVCDLESATTAEVAALLEGAGAVVFAAGAGPGSGVPRKDTVDRGASVLLADACELAGVRRFVQVSAMGVDGPPREGTDEVFAAYLRAKAAAEEDLRSRDLDWTILRPGRLTDAPGTGRVALAPPPLGRGEVTRDDVAAVLLALLDEPATSGLTLDLLNGDTPVSRAVRDVLPG